MIPLGRTTERILEEILNKPQEETKKEFIEATQKQLVNSGKNVYREHEKSSREIPEEIS